MAGKLLERNELKESQTVQNEIHAATHSMLDKYEGDLCWTSVGLLNRVGSIVWDSHVNEKWCENNIKKQGNLGLTSKCQKCKPKKGKIAPPCLIYDNIKILCEFRKNLGELERITMEPDSFSMGDLSLKYFRQEKEYPYISIKEISNYPWIRKRGDILKKLNYTKKSSTNSNEYKDFAKKCMPKKSTGALIPLVQAHGSQTVYIGAIVLCAKKDSKIWGNLPRIKATALSLAEVHKHIFYLTGEKSKDFGPKLLNILFSFSESDKLFSGTCNDAGCKLHGVDKKDRHNNDCRILQNKGLFPEAILNKDKMSFLKSLFYYNPDILTQGKSVSSDITMIEDVINVFKSFIPPSKIKIDVEILHAPFVWPTAPGLVSLISIIDLYFKLDSFSPEIKSEAVKEVGFEKPIQKPNDLFLFSIYFKLLNKEGALDLAAKWSGLNPGGSNTTKTIWSCMRGDISDYRNKVVIPKENTETMTQVVNKILDKADYPIFYPSFCEDRLYLSWFGRPEKKKKKEKIRRASGWSK